MSKNLDKYLAANPIINCHHPAIMAICKELERQYEGDIARTEAAFHYVRDRIAHSFDIAAKEVTCTASEVLEAGHGICYAKSHLLAAILRGMGIPAGICYQRVCLDRDKTCLHALNAAYISSINRWVRFDARGNKLGVDAQFSLDKEQLTFPLNEQLGEKDYPEIYSEPLPQVLHALQNSGNCEMLRTHLPEDV